MAVKKITRRWLLNSFGVIVFIILVIEFAFAAAVRGYYYNYVYESLASRAELADISFARMGEESGGQEFSAAVRNYVATFSARERMELMILDENGRVVQTSSGFEPDVALMADFEAARANPGATERHVGMLGGEKVMSVAKMLGTRGDELAAVRLCTAIGDVDRQIAGLITAMAAVGVAILALVLFSSSYFIGSIVNPVGEIGDTARRIAQGDFKARLKKRKTKDEIGELCDIINHMAEELATAEQLKNDFISSVSHELRTPLTAIQGWAETMRTHGGADPELLEKGMGIIIGETTRLSGMVEELLDFSRMQSGRLRLVKTKIDALAELSEAAMMYTERARREGIRMHFEELETPAVVYGDRNKLRQVFINVIDNAVKYSDSGGEVSIVTDITDKLLRIEIKDSGIGIRPEDLPQIKDRFFKADSTRRGSGIGLAVADEIITRHGGTLDIASSYGVGSLVTITLPIYEGTRDMAQFDDPAE